MEIYLHKQWSNPAMQDKYYLGIIHIKNKMCSIDSLFQRERGKYQIGVSQ